MSQFIGMLPPLVNDLGVKVPSWTWDYVDGLRGRFDGIVDGLDDRLEAITDVRTAPAVDDITIGSGRKVRASVLFFDIRGFTKRTANLDLPKLKSALYMLDVVIPVVMHVVFDHGGYVEKNTGDGVMALFGIEDDDRQRANVALDVATISFYVLKEVVNPHLEDRGIEPVDARIGIGMGTMLLARIGTSKGRAKHDRSHLTAVGPPANLASKLQHLAGTNQVWVDDLVRTHAADYRSDWFHDETPKNWTWTWSGGRREGEVFRIWRYSGRRNDPTR